MAVTTLPCDRGRHNECPGEGLISGRWHAPHQTKGPFRTEWITVNCECRCHGKGDVVTDAAALQAAKRAANLLFNLAQVKNRPLTDSERDTMRAAADDLDAAIKAAGGNPWVAVLLEEER